jgi:hypothetical protein
MPEKAIYREVSTSVEGSIWVIRKVRIKAFFILKRKRASPYAAGMDSTVAISMAPTEIIRLFLNPLSVSLEAESCFWNASSVRLRGQSGVGTSKIST